jgi:hypothetical protein
MYMANLAFVIHICFPHGRENIRGERSNGERGTKNSSSKCGTLSVKLDFYYEKFARLRQNSMRRARVT